MGRMESFRVWEGDSLRSGQYTDVKGKDYTTVARRFFGKSKDMKLQHDSTGTAAVTVRGNVHGHIRKIG